jgi:hypothetical protein
MSPNSDNNVQPEAIPGEDTGAKGEVRRTKRTSENKKKKRQLFECVSFE